MATKNRYDAIVVGGGTGGLIAGGLLAKAGRSVAVLEAEENPGGFARSFESDGCSFDLADHLIMGCAPDGRFGAGLLHEILSSLGVADKVSFVAVDPFYSVDFQGNRFILPGNWETHIAALCDYFPAEADGIRTLFALYDQTYREVVTMPVVPRMWDLVTAPFRFRTLFSQRNYSLSELFARHIHDPVLRTVHTALWPYLGLGPRRASALGWAAMMASYVGEGAFYPIGGYQQFSNAIAEGLRHHGGELMCGERVAAIRCRAGSVTGVHTSNGIDIQAPLVIAAMDPRQALGSMLIGDSAPQYYIHRLSQGELSISVYALYLVVDLDLQAEQFTHETAVMTADSDQALSSGLAGDVQMVIVTIPTLTDPGRSSTGQHTVVVKTVCPAEDVQHHTEAIAQNMIDLAGRVIPGLRDAIRKVHARTIDDPWPLQRLGPIYGWAMTPEQMALNRLQHVTPINGLYLAGHWSQPCAGVWGAAASAVQLVRRLLEQSPRDGLIPVQL